MANHLSRHTHTWIDCSGRGLHAQRKATSDLSSVFQPANPAPKPVVIKHPSRKMRSSSGLAPKTCNSSSSRPLPARPQPVPIAGRQGLQTLCCASKPPHGCRQQLSLCAGPLQQSHAVKHRRPATCLPAAAQEQPVAADPAVAASEDAAPSISSADYHSNGTDVQQQQAESSSSSGDSDSTTEDAPAAPTVSIKVLSEPGELTAVARLRAEAYYENDHSRFAASFKKQFASQEVESLRQRTSPTTSAQRPQLCDCLVAVDAAGSVLGCIDIRLPQAYTKMQTIGVPDDDTAGCYLLNVVVAEEHRGLGVGKQVMRAAMSRAVHHWGAQRLYTHVEADNEVANRLYRSCGFQEHSSEAKYANVSSLGRLVLLMATAEDVQQQPQQAAGSDSSST